MNLDDNGGLKWSRVSYILNNAFMYEYWDDAYMKGNEHEKYVDSIRITFFGQTHSYHPYSAPLPSLDRHYWHISLSLSSSIAIPMAQCEKTSHFE